ncbi:Gfo/Idh/MocA family oxidoreductase [Haladaptatus sp. AB643]|uniref:Gfo/Idh/MocA family protein n=1 Tax=Haladaptatus sp. AB643 TaxID=2934174 RepID=UPI00209BD5B1|nr:Gfo/Idh/MocA family oxidoreductase [Haladaptatus sp. AB643]MCO8243724.1 Gfo/Idh/MocA family oxidoreductase [Haladaptatus sp. AB643]
MSEPLSVGVLGYRFMGKAHANALARLPMFFPDAPEIERRVLVGRDEAALSDAVDELGFEGYGTDWREVVGDVDVFYNLGPNSIHADPTIAALEAGTSVFCEKPLAHTLDDAERMRDAARESDAVAGIAFNYRFVPAVRYAKRLIEDGELGEIRHVRGSYLQDFLADPDAPWAWRLDEEVAGSGALGDLGAHTLDLAGFLVGDRTGDIEDISGRLRTFVDERPVDGEDETRPVTVDDAYTAHATFENGAVGTFEASRFATGHKNDHSLEINGSEGSLRFSIERPNELEYLGPDDKGFQTVMVTADEDPYLAQWWPDGHVLGWEHTFVHENYEFLSTVANGGVDDTISSDVPTFEDGYRVQRLLSAIVESDERGESVALG